MQHALLKSGLYKTGDGMQAKYSGYQRKDEIHEVHEVFECCIGYLIDKAPNKTLFTKP